MINQSDPLSQFTWWSSLKHGGLLIAPARLASHFSTEPPELSNWWAERLRSAVQAQQNTEKLGAQAALLDTVLEGVLKLPALEWKKASAVGPEWGHRLITGENFKPRRLWLGKNSAVLPVFDDDVKQIGIGTGRRSIARVRAELVQMIRARRTMAFEFFEKQLTPVGIHDQLVGVFERIHNLPIQDTEKRKEIYEQHYGPGTAYRQLRAAFDTWCAIWFWPGDLLEHAPLPVDFLQPAGKAKDIVRELRDAHRFFHWELEFPDVFQGEVPGFDAVIGNPPWEVQKPNSKEFFSDVDPLYRGYGKQEALDRQLEYFGTEARVELNWMNYCARLKARSNWVKYVGHPFGDQVWLDKDDKPHHDFPLDKKFGQSAADHKLWADLRKGRSSFADPAHPFLHQGSADLNTYKMFLEAGHALLRQGGRLALLIPSGIYSDKGAGSLRRLFLKKSRWSHLYAFQNERFLFGAVHHSFKVAAIQVEKGGEPSHLRTRFRLGPGDSPEAHELETDILNENGYLHVSVSEIEEFSPHSGAILEIRASASLAVVRKLYAVGTPLGKPSTDGWQIQYATEFHMSADSELFSSRWKWEEKGYRADEYGHWLRGTWKPYSGSQSALAKPDGVVFSSDRSASIELNDIADVALPMYQGAMINQFDYCASAFRRTEGRRGFKWVGLDWQHKFLEPQYLMAREHYLGAENAIRGPKLALRDIARSTDARTFISAVVPDLPCCNTLPVLACEKPWLLAALANSFVIDFALRERMAGTHLVWFVLADVPLVRKSELVQIHMIEQLAAALSLSGIQFASVWKGFDRSRPWKSNWARTATERLRIRAVLEATIAHLYGLEFDDMKFILRGCDYPIHKLQDSKTTRSLDTKGFWRQERNLPPELRLSVLTMVAFAELQKLGLKAFFQANEGVGWLLPQTIRLADYGLGQDDRAKEYQVVASVLGPRFYPWQLEQSVEESWAECECHAEVLAKLLPLPDSEKDTGESADGAPVDLFGDPVDTDLFGSPVYTKARKR